MKSKNKILKKNNYILLPTKNPKFFTIKKLPTTKDKLFKGFKVFKNFSYNIKSFHIEQKEPHDPHRIRTVSKRVTGTGRTFKKGTRGDEKRKRP